MFIALGGFNTVWEDRDDPLQLFVFGRQGLGGRQHAVAKFRHRPISTFLWAAIRIFREREGAYGAPTREIIQSLRADYPCYAQRHAPVAIVI